MPKYFMRDTPYFAFEAMMMEPPHAHRSQADDDEAVMRKQPTSKKSVSSGKSNSTHKRTTEVKRK